MCKQGQNGAPLIQSGIAPPVNSPIQSFVKELQLKSSRWYWEEAVQNGSISSVNRLTNLVCGIVFSHFVEEFVERWFIYRSFPHIYYLQRLSMLRNVCK